MIKQQEDGLWLAKCDICSWRSVEPEEAGARRKLSRHFNVTHRRGDKGASKRIRRTPPRVVDRRIRGRQRSN
jgi:hypothetical protein